MPTTEQTVVKQAAVTPSGKQVVSQKTETSASVATSETIGQVVYFIVGVVEIVLLARLILKLMGANPVNSFVLFIYNISGVLTLPFSGIFPSGTTQGIVTTSILEPATVVAMLVYLVIAVGIVQLVNILSRSPEA